MDARRESEATLMKNRTTVERKSERELVVTRTFDGPARGIRCARAIRSAATNLDLDVRVGLHTGEIELRGDDDIGGLAVHITQRVSAAAQPAEIVVSSTVKDLVAGSGIEFEDRGARELKGIPGTWHLFAVTN